MLADPAGQARVAVAPKYQGRVMTSTTGGDAGPSFGWIGRAAIESGEKQPHMNVFGGEDRFWLGPEGGQYALYFKRGDPFDLEHWQTPEPFDWGPWDIASQSATQVSFRKQMALVNYSGTSLDLAVDRSVRLLTAAEVASHLGSTVGDAVRVVAFESSNTVTNTGSAPWRPESGLVSIWILGQFTPSPRTTIAIPFASGTQASAGPIVNDKYFGAVPADRLAVKDTALFFKADGQYRSKIGLPPARALDVAGSYDAAAHVLTLVQYTHPAGESRYVNSMWEIQQEPYKGDTINSYNDGPVAPGQAAARPVLRARDLVTRASAPPWRALHPRPPHHPSERTRSRPGSDRARHVEGRTVGHHRRVRDHIDSTYQETAMNRRDALRSLSLAGGASLLASAQYACRGDCAGAERRVRAGGGRAPRRSRSATSRRSSPRPTASGWWSSRSRRPSRGSSAGAAPRSRSARWSSRRRSSSTSSRS